MSDISTVLNLAMELSRHSEASICAAPHKFPALYGTRKFVNVLKSLPLNSILSQMNPFYFSTIHFINALGDKLVYFRNGYR
jgi:hypothetical protein